MFRRMIDQPTLAAQPAANDEKFGQNRKDDQNTARPIQTVADDRYQIIP
jgi:hypothetical protein